MPKVSLLGLVGMCLLIFAVCLDVDTVGCHGSVNLLAGLQPGAPVRNLRDLFVTYQPYPEQILPFVRTACVIDAVQATAYLGHAVVWLYRAIDYNGLECPENTPAGCAISVAGGDGQIVGFGSLGLSSTVKSKK